MRVVDAVRWTLLFGGLAALGYVGYVYADAAVYQKYENWAFDEELRGRAPSVPEFLKDSTPLRKVLRRAAVEQEREETQDPQNEADRENPAGPARRAPAPTTPKQVLERALIGRIAIPRLRVSAIVREGDDDRTLRRAVGHLPDTPLPWQAGNVGLAGHRDTFFRGLKSVRKNDKIVLKTLQGEYEYVVDSMKIVGPNDLSVLAKSPGNALTLVTCYPFNYVGNAPRRFIVRARQVSAPIARPELDVAGGAASAAVGATP
jgi:sortase A